MQKFLDKKSRCYGRNLTGDAYLAGWPCVLRHTMKSKGCAKMKNFGQNDSVLSEPSFTNVDKNCCIIGSQNAQGERHS